MGGKHVADALHSAYPEVGAARKGARPRRAAALSAAPRRMWHAMWHPGPVRRARWRRQRARRGWSEEDTWGLGEYLMEVIAGSLDYFRAHLHSHPVNVTEGEWFEMLGNISGPVGRLLTVVRDGPADGESVDDYARRYLQAQQDTRTALTLLADILGDLWD